MVTTDAFLFFLQIALEMFPLGFLFFIPLFLNK